MPFEIAALTWKPHGRLIIGRPMSGEQTGLTSLVSRSVVYGATKPQFLVPFNGDLSIWDVPEYLPREVPTY